MSKATEDNGNSAETKAQDELKRMRLNSAKRLLKDLKPVEIDDIVGEATKVLADKEAPQTSIGWRHIKEYEDEIKEAVSIWGKVGGVSSGLPTFDKVVGGLRPGQTYLIAGESNNGKSAIAAQMAVNISKSHKVGYISLEMMPGDNGARINHMNHGDDMTLNIDGLDIYFQNSPLLNEKQLRPLFEQAKELDFKVIFLDYLQFLGRGMTNEEVSRLSQTLKRLAMEYEMPLVVIVSLRKSNGGRKWYDISLEDLMGTSAIAYDSDNTVVVSRRDLNDEFDDKHVYLKVLKLRNMDKNKNNEFLWFNWDRTRISEVVVPLHIIRAQEAGKIEERDIA